MSGFTSPIVGGQGTILIPAIQSPNFNLVAQTGWSIQKNGNAYFFNITASGSITASSFVGTDFFINSLGEFFYSGTPAAGNLIASIAPTSGANDGHGNPYNEGISVYGSNNAVINMSDNSGSPGIFLHAASVSHITTNAEIFTFADNAGLANEIQCIVMSMRQFSFSQSQQTILSARLPSLNSVALSSVTSPAPESFYQETQPQHSTLVTLAYSRPLTELFR